MACRTRYRDRSADVGLHALSYFRAFVIQLMRRLCVEPGTVASLLACPAMDKDNERTAITGGLKRKSTCTEVGRAVLP